MPNLSDRQAAWDALETAYLVNLVVESEGMLVDSDTESSSSGSSSSSSAGSMCRNMATWSASLAPNYSFIVLTRGAMAFAMAHLIVT